MRARCAAGVAALASALGAACGDPGASPLSCHLDAITPPGDAAAPPVPGDAGEADGATRPLRVLLYGRTTGWRHASIGTGIAAIAGAAQAEGLAWECRDDLAAITPENLARYGAVVLVSTTGEPLGPDSGPGVRALIEYVRAGGGLLGVHAVVDAYGPGTAYTTLIGGQFRAHPGNVRPAQCYPEGAHPAVAALPAAWGVTDEIYLFDAFNPANQVVLRCDAVEGGERLPVAWHRDEGAGRVFVTTLGHASEAYRDEAFLMAHVMPALRWVMRR